MVKTVVGLWLALAWTWGIFAASVPPDLELKARERAEGNRLSEAVALTRSLLRNHGTPAQILHVRVDGIGSHVVAGVMLEGRPKHPLNKPAFLNQVVGIAQAAFDRQAIEEVDIWAIVPIPVSPNAVVSGAMAVPTSKTVFAGTFRRAERPVIGVKVRDRRGIYVDPGWEAGLVSEVPALGAAKLDPSLFARLFKDLEPALVS